MELNIQEDRASESSVEIMRVKELPDELLHAKVQ